MSATQAEIKRLRALVRQLRRETASLMRRAVLAEGMLAQQQGQIIAECPGLSRKLGLTSPRLTLRDLAEWRRYAQATRQ